MEVKMNKKKEGSIKKKNIVMDDSTFFGPLAKNLVQKDPFQSSILESMVHKEEEVEEIIVDSDKEETIQKKEVLKIEMEVDVELNPWIIQIPKEERNKICNQFLRLGHLVQGMTQTTIQSDSFLKPIQESLEKKLTELDHKNELNLSVMNTRVSENLDRVKTTIDKFTEFSNKSSFKGAMGENLVERVIEHYFPDDTIVNTSKKTAESDYHMKCHNGVMFLIESKFYTSVVNKQELDKFRRDLVKTGFPVGIFISLSSGIVGKKRFDIERLNEHQMILYIPNAGFDGGSIIWSILFAKEVLKYVIEHKVEREMEDFHEVYDSFQDIYQYFSTLKLQIFDTRNHVQKQMDDLYHKTLEIHLQIHHLIAKMKNQIQKRLFMLGDIQRRELENGVEESLQKMNEQQDEENRILYQRLKEFCDEKNIQIEVDSSNLYQWSGFLGSDEVFRMKCLTKKKEIIILKYKCTMLFNIENIEVLKKLIE
jgi:hypothetical protein